MLIDMHILHNIRTLLIIVIDFWSEVIILYGRICQQVYRLYVRENSIDRLYRFLGTTVTHAGMLADMLFLHQRQTLSIVQAIIDFWPDWPLSAIDPKQKLRIDRLYRFLVSIIGHPGMLVDMIFHNKRCYRPHAALSINIIDFWKRLTIFGVKIY